VTSAALNRDDDEPAFVPRKFFLRGFCSYKAEATEGLSHQVLSQFWASVSQHLKPEVRNLVMPGDRALFAPRFRNRQLTVFVADGAPVDATYVLCRELGEICSQKHLTLSGRQVYWTSDQPPWKTRRNYVLKSAEVWVKQGMPSLAVVADWPAGRLWVESDAGKPAFCLGEVVAGEWVWHQGCAAILSQLQIDSFSY
jgi:hypothetical protein